MGMPHPFDYEQFTPPSFQNNPSKPEYEYKSASPAKKAKHWANHFELKHLETELKGGNGKPDKKASEHHAQNAAHLEATAPKDFLTNFKLDPPKPKEVCGECGGSDDDHSQYCSRSEDDSDQYEESKDKVKGFNQKEVSRGENKPTGPLGERVLQQLSSHGHDEPYNMNMGKAGAHSKMEHEMVKKLNAGSISTDDLFRSYKHTPHMSTSVLLKYITNRVDHMKEYDNPGKAERLDKDFMALHQFGKAADKNGHMTVGNLHSMLKTNPHLVDGLVAERDRHQSMIRGGVGLNTRKINGQDYVALTRGLDSDKMSHEHALSSWADRPTINFGTHKHHSWVPLKDLWYSYNLGSDYTHGTFGPEDEYLMAHNPKANGHRYLAQARDVKQNNFKKLESGPLGNTDQKGEPVSGKTHWMDYAKPEFDRSKLAPHLENSTDTELAHYVEHHAPEEARGDEGFDALDHKNAGPETYAAMQRRAYLKPLPYRHLQARGMPAEEAMKHFKREPTQQAAENILRNPNLEAKHIPEVVAHAEHPEDVIDMADAVTSGSQNAKPEVANEMLRQLDQHGLLHDFGKSSRAKSTASALTRFLKPEDRARKLNELAMRPVHEKPDDWPANKWNANLMDSLLARATPEQAQDFFAKYDMTGKGYKKLPKGKQDAEYNEMMERYRQEYMPPTDKVVKDLAKLGTRNSDALEGPLTEKQKSHILLHGNQSVVEGYLDTLVKRGLRSTKYGGAPTNSAMLTPQQQNEILDRKDKAPDVMFTVSSLPGLTSESVGKILKQSGSIAPALVKIAMENLRSNKNLDEKTIIGALPPSAHALMPFLAQKPFERLSSAERKQVAQYKKNVPNTTPIWDLLTSRVRKPESLPEGHIIKPLPAEEQLAEGLGKALPGFKFPKMGVRDDRKETPILENQQQLDNKTRAMANGTALAQLWHNKSTKPPLKDQQVAGPGAHGFDAEGRQNNRIEQWEFMNHPHYGREVKNQIRSQVQHDGSAGASAVRSPTTISYARGEAITPGHAVHGPKSSVATKLHEDFHNVFKRVQQRYGQEGRENLATNLMANLKLQDPAAHHALETYFTHRLGASGHRIPFSNEEHFTYLLNYLNDPVQRENFHNYAFGPGATTTKPGEVRRFQDNMKRAYKHSVKAALTADPTWALRPSDKSKSDWDTMEREEKAHK